MDHTISEKNGKVTVTVDRPGDGRGLYRSYAVGPNGARCLLGTLTPDGGRLTLRRTLGVDALRQRGCYPIAAVETTLAQSFSTSLPALPGWAAPPAALPFPDDVLRRAYAAAPQRPYYQPWNGGFALAFPLRENAPFPMPALFCFAQAVCLQHHSYWLFPFDKNGLPQFSPYNPT